MNANLVSKIMTTASHGCLVLEGLRPLDSLMASPEVILQRSAANEQCSSEW